MQREALSGPPRAGSQDDVNAETASASFDARERAIRVPRRRPERGGQPSRNPSGKDVGKCGRRLPARPPAGKGYVRRMGERLAASSSSRKPRRAHRPHRFSLLRAARRRFPGILAPEWKRTCWKKKPQYEFGQRMVARQIGRCVPLAWWGAPACRPALIDWAQKTDWRNVLLLQLAGGRPP